MRPGKSPDHPSWIDPENGEDMDRLALAAQRRLYPFIGAAVRDPHAAEDVLQETLLAMVERMNTLRTAKSFWPWLYRIASNKVQDHFRRQQRFSALTRSALLETDRSFGTTWEQTGALERMIDVENTHELSDAIGEMDWHQQQIIHLRWFEQMPYAKIADQTQMSQTRARTNLHRAKMALKKRLRALSA